ncbi:serine/threonine protein kinase, partial [Pyxidicoccus sp. 3LFB2]
TAVLALAVSQVLTPLLNGQRQGPSPVEVAVQADREVAVRVESPRHHPLVRAVKVGKGPSQVERFVLTTSGGSPREEAARSDGRTARVKFAVQPWAQVTCSGKRLGETPFDAVDMRVGRHECRFFNPELKKTHTREIDVRAIDLNVVNVKLE